ncbi:tetratricopeptide repeat protein [uncultured Brevibacterium sp.]|uniref:tetratricopeptide repeat protein n=1 Tax=uncultured Brevibacterium sp. TaxID=189678 RepID=UPI002601097B|nr:tetratricopeptide repeat protein [uncultured Brevibacterium sp.]
MSKAKIGAIIMVVLLGAYLVVMVNRGWILLTDPEPIAKVMGVALFVLPVIAVWAIVRELFFGASMERLAKILEEEGGLPPDNLPRTPGGRIIREAADKEFEKYRSEAEADPDNWRSWFRLSCAYDASGDRKRARSTMRKAIKLHAGDERR